MNVSTGILNQVHRNRARGEGEPKDIFLGFETDKQLVDELKDKLSHPDGTPTNPETLEGATIWGMRVHVLKYRPHCAFVGRTTAADIR